MVCATTGDGPVLVVDPRGKKDRWGEQVTFIAPLKEDCSFWKVDLLPVLDSVISQSTDWGGESFWSLTVNALSRPSIPDKRWWKEAGRICLVMKDSYKQETSSLHQE